MQPMTVREIAAAVHGVWKNPQAEVPVVSAVSTDSRKQSPGSLFIPWVGEKFDGHGAGGRRSRLAVRQTARKTAER